MRVISSLVFVAGVAGLVAIEQPPTVVVAIIAVTVVGVLVADAR